jgi:hypothetical protein
MIEEALESFKAGNSPHPVFFYCSSKTADPQRADPRTIIASLARQLSCLEPEKSPLKPTIDLYREKEEEDRGFPSRSIQMDESQKLILQLVEQYPLTTVFIDAIDECDPLGRSELLDALEAILRESSHPVKIVLSSRNNQDLISRLQHYPHIEIDSERNSEDIKHFVKTRTEKLIQDRELLQLSSSQAEMKELIISKVAAVAAGV